MNRFVARAICFFAVILAGGVPSYGQTPISLRFDSLPSAQGWTYFQADDPEAQIFQANGTSLIQNTIGIAHGGPNYALFDIVDGSKPFVLKVRARIISYEFAGPGGFFFDVRTATPNQEYAINFSPFGLTDPLGNGAAVNTSVFHEYILKATPGGPYSLTIDGQFAFGGPFSATGGALNAIQLGDGSDLGANAKVEITEFEFVQQCVNLDDITLFAGGPFSLDGKPTSMVASFTPTDGNGLPVGLDAAKAACGVTRFNFQQFIDAWPAPSTLFPANASAAGWPAGVPVTAPTPSGSFPDPPAGGYTYDAVGTGGRYPYYWPDDPGDQVLRNKVIPACNSLGCANFTIETDSTLLFVDNPADPCLPGGAGAGCAGFAPQFSDLKFTTALVGVSGAGQNRKTVDIGFSWSWISTFNGTSNGVVATSSSLPVDSLTGTGGIRVEAINGVRQLGPTVTCSTTPDILWPPNGKAVLVTLSGSIVAGTSALVPGSSVYAVEDEYGEVQPRGRLDVATDGTYRSQIALISSRDAARAEGRTYRVVVHSTDVLGNASVCVAAVKVPHDLRIK